MKAIPHLQGYFADRNGTIWSTHRGNNRWNKPHSISLWKDDEGYLHVTLRPKGKRKRFAVHRLVAAAFLGPCPDGCVCSHKNGKPGDNRPSNLEYITQELNVHKKRTHGTMTRGELQYRSKLKSSDVMEIRGLCAGGVRDVEVARRFGINPATVHSIKTGRTWKHLPLVGPPIRGARPGDPILFKPADNMDPRPIPGFPGYRAGVDGGIWCWERQNKNRWPLPYQLKPYPNRDGYPEVFVRRDGRVTHVTVHRLVAAAWIGERPHGYVCHHLNGDRTDARAENLSYVTSRDNVMAKRGHGTMPRGETAALSILTTRQVNQIRRLSASGKHTSRSIAKRFGINQSTVWSIKTGRSWKHLLKQEI